MKMKKYILGITAMLAFASCNDDFLEKYPKDALSEETAFVTAENFKTFAWGYYGVFTDATNFYRGMNNEQDTYNADMLGGWLTWKNKTVDGNQMRTQLKVTGATGNGWTFAQIKRCNFMLENIDGSKMSQADKDHYRSVGLFWRAYSYYELISRFGDVPWIDKVIQESDTDLIYGARTPRKEVADHLLSDLQWAETHIRPTGDGANTINTDCVLALMSRFFLFEGTWRKYHGLGDSDKYLDECIRVSKLLANKYPTVASSYDMLLNSPDLKLYPGMILYKQFETGTSIVHLSGRYEKTTALSYDMPKCTVENYLCKDGRPISTSPLYQGDKTMFKEFRNRDLRLIGTVVPPYSQKTKVVGGTLNPDYTDVSPAVYNAVGYYAGDPDVTDNMEFNAVVKAAFPGTSKRLPVLWLSGDTSFNAPNIADIGAPQFGSWTGYTLWRHYNTWDDFNANVSDKPVFWIEETLLNLAEASFERGQFNQGVADLTINKLRPRAGVANMVVANIDADWDTKRDQTVQPILWEIRRERMSELIGMGFGFQDVRRWKKGDYYINQPNLGVYVKRSSWRNLTATGAVTTTTNAKWASTTGLPLVNKDFSGTNLAEGYVKRFDDPTKIGKGWLDKYYLEWIPTNQIVLNPNIKQNPGW